MLLKGHDHLSDHTLSLIHRNQLESIRLEQVDVEHDRSQPMPSSSSSLSSPSSRPARNVLTLDQRVPLNLNHVHFLI